MVSESSEKTLGRSLGISEDELQSAIDPIQNVRRRNIVGGPAPESVKAMIEARWGHVEAEENRHKKRIGKLSEAYEKLAEAEKVLTGKESQ